MELGRCQSINFGMRLNTDLVQNPKARAVTNAIAERLSPLKTNAMGFFSGTDMVRLSIHQGTGKSRVIKIDPANVDLDAIEERVRQTVAMA